jgi:glutamate dehydrogenase
MLYKGTKGMNQEDQLKNVLIKEYGSKKGLILYKKYANAFSIDYLNDVTASASMLIKDIQYLEQLSAVKPIRIYFYFTSQHSQTILHLRLLQQEKPGPLADVLPMLENLDFRTDRAQSYCVKPVQTTELWINDFSAIADNKKINIEEAAQLFQDVLTHYYFGELENDAFNKLVLNASCSWREVVVLRAYAKYLHQLGFGYSQTYIEKTVTAYPDIAKNLVSLFKISHDPKETGSSPAITKLTKQILEALDAVISLDEDKILRRILSLIQATLRTNYFQQNENNRENVYLAFKFNSSAIPEMPLPVPLYEIFVYSPRFEGIHLRATKVARGGIRWSDRKEDFRREILGLMKAQKVKNAIIVPSGAKGGFVLKSLKPEATRDDIQKEVMACYKLFIKALLDITDNIKGKNFVRPKNVVCYDEVDPYLVVAADKGTAALSDVANSIASETGFWLGDAFASGGSTGYDHKRIGITARGAWESVKRHFRELNIDIQQKNITVIGIGDMSGDVFGNGMTYSKKIKLLAAFDHRHIFLDPDPDPEISYHERLRLFSLPTSSWQDYQPALISPGGGVFKRSLKSITLTPQIKKILQIETNTLTPNELIRAILKAPVDLLFNGGIGTYVKASHERHMDAGDRTNDTTRVNGNELRAVVVGEGGNLGFTQLGRIEFALKGGLINTDFIDNSAGVDCSDHEVNLKILLDLEVKKKTLSLKKRNELLTSVTQEIAQLVLTDNYYQALVMSFSAFHGKRNIMLHVNFIKDMESQGILNRQVEFLPEDKVLLERKAAGEGLTRPELAVLLAYTKIHLQQEILQSDLPEDKFISQMAKAAFPESISKKYEKTIREHRLYRDIIATQLSNYVVNEMGMTFVYRAEIETGSSVADIIRAYLVASNIFDTQSLKKTVEDLDFKISMEEQYFILFHLRKLINISTRWFLRSGYLNKDLQELIKYYSLGIQKLQHILPSLMTGMTKEYLESITTEFLKTGLSKALGEKIGAYRAIYTCLNIIDIAHKYQFDLIKTAEVYFASGDHANLVWFRDQIADESAHQGDWDSLARLTLRDELDVAQRMMTVAIMKQGSKKTSPVVLIEEWKKQNHPIFKRWEQLLAMLHSSSHVEYAMFFIVIREFIGLLQANK